MKILFLTQILPYPLDAGPKIRAYFVLRHLAESGHRITLLSFIRASDRPEYADHLRRYCERVEAVPMRRSRLRDGLTLLGALGSGRPFLIARDWSRAMTRRIDALAQVLPPWDAIHADQLWMAPYALRARSRCPAEATPVTVLDQHNAVFRIPDRLAASETNRLKRELLRLESRRLERYEAAACRRFDRVVWVTAEDRDALFPNGEASTASLATVIPISVASPPRTGLRATSSGRRRVTFMGGLHWPPNLEGIRWFASTVWPQVRQRLPGFVLTIIGRDPSGELGDLGAAVEATGYLPDPKAHLEETAVFVVPLHAGGGMRVKILDAWSQGLPVVSTTVGADGIDAWHMENIYLAVSPEAFAAGVVEIAENPELAENLAAGGRRTLDTAYCWRKTYRAWDQVYPCESSTSSLTLPA